MRIHAFALICFGLASSGCFPTITTPPLSPSDAPSSGSAYIYGFFGMDRKTYLEHHFGLGLACSDGKEYTLWFVHEHPLLMFEVAPARCSLKYAIVHDENSGNNLQFAAPREVLHNVELRAGKAYYLGNLVAHAEYEAKDELVGMNIAPDLSSPGLVRLVWKIATKEKYQWKIVDSANAYETDTRVMRQKFANFRTIETEKRLLDAARLSTEEQRQEHERIQKNDALRESCRSDFDTCLSPCGPIGSNVACLRACRKSYDACLNERGDF